MSAHRAAPADLGGQQGQNFDVQAKSARKSNGIQGRRRDSVSPPDLFREARADYTVPGVWKMLRLPGEPKPSCRSPFRDEKSPSFTIFDEGRAWKDHGTGEGGDVIEFIRHAIGGEYGDVRDWLMERLGIDRTDGAIIQRQRFVKPPQPRKSIEWPGELVEGTEPTWQAFAAHRGLSPEGVEHAVTQGVLRFTVVDGRKCFVVTDSTRRAAEIRDIRGGLFGGRKAFPLAGVDKTWLPGAVMLAGMPQEARVLITEGATDLLTTIDLYRRYDGPVQWVPCALLGAACKTLSPDCGALLKGRHVRIVPDADEAGRRMAEHWTDLLRGLGCWVDVVTLPDGSDLTDHKDDIEPETLFSA